MSDDEDDMMSDEDYGFDYTDDDEDEEGDVNVENQYYNSKALIESDVGAALDGFRDVVDVEVEPGEWGFRALKQCVKLQFSLGHYEKMLHDYNRMLEYVKSAVTRNYSEKSINKILDIVSTSDNTEILQRFYETTLASLADASNERLWFKTNLKLGKLWYDRKEYSRLQKIIRELRKSCETEDGSDDLKKGTQLLEIYALEIQWYTDTRNSKKLKALYEKSLQVKSAIPHPKIMGIIRECGGKMHMAEREWEKAHTDFFEAFKNYDECGNARRISCLKYLVLANMLMNSSINPFDSTEAKPYKNDPEVLSMTNLVSAYQHGDITAFEKTLKNNRKTIMDDGFIRNYIEDLLRNIRTQVLLRMIKPYTRIRIPFISQELNIAEDDVEALIIGLILDSKIEGKIDQVNHLLELGAGHDADERRFQSVSYWANQAEMLHVAVNNRLG